MFKFIFGIIVGFLIYDLDLVPFIISFTNESGLTDYFINTLQNFKDL